ncbi:hypothetical protein SAMN05216464_102339 [Mucilaginibacter pineti]|uniref:Uncharacterized protein n=1 Tax=Mucilaginibacter pineti TaxID=1391627 RepID=A0A1G6WYX0_9SPHI|nr:hypothetical protein SAMN05216464_102339 [Mucilaginibacter pineti]
MKTQNNVSAQNSKTKPAEMILKQWEGIDD